MLKAKVNAGAVRTEDTERKRDAGFSILDAPENRYIRQLRERREGPDSPRKQGEHKGGIFG
jgi:hypothetical protein